MNYNPMLMCDWYKLVHWEQYNPNITKIVSYYTPRMSRLKDVDHLTMFGLQAFIKEYLEEAFNEGFFKRPINDVVDEYVFTMRYGLRLPEAQIDTSRIHKLHELGYLPLRIRAVPEGRRTKIGVPQIEIANTHPDFAWLVNSIETMLSCSMWHTQIAAEASVRYFKIAERWAARTCSADVNPHTLISDFSMRGQHSVESATKASAAWLLMNYGSATVPALFYLQNYYNCSLATGVVGNGAISTEHSVMCSNKAIDGDEITFIKRLLTEIYPNNSFSMVSDSYDYWNLVTNLLPQCREEILNHNGCLLVRGDSGDPVEVVAGVDIDYLSDDLYEDIMFVDDKYTRQALMNWDDPHEDVYYIHWRGKYYRIKSTPEWGSKRSGYTDCGHYVIDDWDITWEEIEPTAEIMGTVWALDQAFGSTVNEKGYKVLNSHVKAIYGDSITPQRAEEIYRRLAQKGYAANNVALGAGSFSFMCLETTDGQGAHYAPYTRDTFGIAVKATYCEDEAERAIPIFKQPKALAWKKSQKGCCIVSLDGDTYTDEHSYAEAMGEENLLTTVWVDGRFVKEYSLNEVRENLEEDYKK